MRPPRGSTCPQALPHAKQHAHALPKRRGMRLACTISDSLTVILAYVEPSAEQQSSGVARAKRRTAAVELLRAACMQQAPLEAARRVTPLHAAWSATALEVRELVGWGAMNGVYHTQRSLIRLMHPST
jgi:hypothetical protein